VEQRHWIPVDNAVLACRPSVDARLDDPELLSIYAARGSMALTIICERCQGGRRAVLGRVFASPAGPIVAIEVCLPPSATRVVTRREALCDHVASSLPGWRRGSDDAPVMVALLSEWDDRAVLSAFCTALGRGGRHGARTISVAALREAVENAHGRKILPV
jgi:hypothetical protein